MSDEYRCHVCDALKGRCELTKRITELEQALERIIDEADEYDDSPANELVDIARKALGRG